MTKRVVRVLMPILVLALPTSAPASTLLRDGDGAWLHQHTRDYTYSIDRDVPPAWAAATRRAAADWSARSTVLTLTETDDAGAANIVVQAGQLGEAPVGVDVSGYHTPALITYNEDRYHAGSLNDLVLSYSTSIACHELGHALGLGHGGTGCMGTNGDWESGGSREPKHPLYDVLDVTRFEHPGDDDVALLDEVYPATGH